MAIEGIDSMVTFPFPLKLFATFMPQLCVVDAEGGQWEKAGRKLAGLVEIVTNVSSEEPDVGRHARSAPG